MACRLWILRIMLSNQIQCYKYIALESHLGLQFERVILYIYFRFSEKRKVIKRRTETGKCTEIDELTKQNLILDNEVLKEQKKMYEKKKEKYNLEMEKIKMEMQLLALKKELLVLQMH